MRVLCHMETTPQQSKKTVKETSKPKNFTEELELGIKAVAIPQGS